jgi:hypothetical protein
MNFSHELIIFEIRSSLGFRIAKNGHGHMRGRENGKQTPNDVAANLRHEPLNQSAGIP